VNKSINNNDAYSIFRLTNQDISKILLENDEMNESEKKLYLDHVKSLIL